jgi:hypothetical protein
MLTHLLYVIQLITLQIQSVIQHSAVGTATALTAGQLPLFFESPAWRRGHPAT